jgi:hypothetical protein
MTAAAFPAVVSVTAGTGRLQETVIAWHPAVWLITKWPLRPLAMQRSYSSENSAAVMAGGGPGQVFSMRAYTSPLATLAHVGGPREVWGRGEELSAGLASSPATPG